VVVSLGPLGFIPNECDKERYPHVESAYLTNNLQQLGNGERHVGCTILITNRKSHMGFRLVPKSVTLNYLERRNGRYFVLFYRTRHLWGPITSKWLKIDSYCLRRKCSPKNLACCNI